MNLVVLEVLALAGIRAQQRICLPQLLERLIKLLLAGPVVTMHLVRMHPQSKLLVAPPQPSNRDSSSCIHGCASSSAKLQLQHTQRCCYLLLGAVGGQLAALQDALALPHLQDTHGSMAS